MSLVVATHNSHKVLEIQERLSAFDIEVKPLPEGLPDAPEDGDTFLANAKQKGLFYSKFVDEDVLSDDSGLTVPALDGEPGILSARYAGRHGDDDANNAKLVTRLQTLGLTQTTASFICAMAVCRAGRVIFAVEGNVDGIVHIEPRGTMGFGYDPLFSPDNTDFRFAEMSIAQKAQFSHRSAAIKAFVEKWKEMHG